MPAKVLNFQTPIGTPKECYPHLSLCSSLPLKVFRGSVFVHVPNKDKYKLVLKTIKCIFLRYILQSKRGTSVTIHQPKGNLLQ